MKSFSISELQDVGGGMPLDQWFLSFFGAGAALQAQSLQRVATASTEMALMNF